MVFSSVTFTFIFLPVVLVLYYLAKEEYRNGLLVIASLLFYTYGEQKAVMIMILSIGVNYFLALGIDRTQKERNRKILLWMDVICNLGILYLFKYLNFSISILNQIMNGDISMVNISMPIGISFFTFQAMSYVIDVYRRNASAEKNICNVALYISFFPQLIAGPIVRYNTIAEQIQNRTSSLEQFGSGAKRFVCGFCKKIILANNLASVAESALINTDFVNQPALTSWLGAICFTLQIFYDFSGYSDMAIGLGRMFGFQFEENFNYPYMSGSVTEFWRRWHISLGRWFRDYVYIPLGGAKVPVWKHIRNLLIVWCLTGLWHGASWSFVLWGLMYFVCLVLEKYLIKPKERNPVFKFVWHIVTLLIVIYGWILFDTESVGASLQCVRSMLGQYGNVWIGESTYAILRENLAYIVLAVVFSFPVAPAMGRVLYRRNVLAKCSDVLIPVGYMTVFLWAVSFLILGAHNPFIYFNF
jgi:D-alanyl-lipoteichoic acid acyltransferase DltB (MBOAT superfamily)